MTTRRDHDLAGSAGRARHRLAVVASALALCLVAGGWWAGTQGYVPPWWEGGWGCSDVGYPSPPPSFEELVGEYGESPYCARVVRGEAWF